MATYSVLFDVAQNGDFRRRVAVAIAAAAVAIFNEDGATAFHALRAAYSTKVVTSQYNLDGAVLAVLADATIAGEANSAIAGNGISDAHIATAIAAVYNVLAGAA